MLQKSSEVFGKNRKMSESSQNDLPTLFESFWKFLEIFGSVRKCSENFGNPRKVFECNRRFMKFFLAYSNLWHLWTEDQIQKFWFVICTSWYYAFCTGITLFAMVLHFLHWCYSLAALLSTNQNRVIFFMYVIGLIIASAFYYCRNRIICFRVFLVYFPKQFFSGIFFTKLAKLAATIYNCFEKREMALSPT